MRQVSIFSFYSFSLFFFFCPILGVELSTLHMLSQNSAAEMSQAACLMELQSLPFTQQMVIGSLIGNRSQKGMGHQTRLARSLLI